jgi:hypothetical protein
VLEMILMSPIPHALCSQTHNVVSQISNNRYSCSRISAEFGGGTLMMDTSNRSSKCPKAIRNHVNERAVLEERVTLHQRGVR